MSVRFRLWLADSRHTLLCRHCELLFDRRRLHRTPSRRPDIEARVRHGGGALDVSSIIPIRLRMAHLFVLMIDCDAQAETPRSMEIETIGNTDEDLDFRVWSCLRCAMYGRSCNTLELMKDLIAGQIQYTDEDTSSFGHGGKSRDEIGRLVEMRSDGRK